MGLVYFPTWMVDFYGKVVGKNTSPMDPMGIYELSGGLSTKLFLKSVFVLEDPTSVCSVPPQKEQ